jgi:rfaE bifunctional protein kinase chain/domain
MTRNRFLEITSNYRNLRVGVCGDFCLDRYLEIDATREEVSIETGLQVHNVVNVRPQPGGAGTILNNLVALGVGTIYPVGFCGLDGEGFELSRALEACAGVRLEHFISTLERRTFTYCKPLLIRSGHTPVELNRLDTKNWSPTPAALQHEIAERVLKLSGELDALIVLDQVDLPETGVITRETRTALGTLAQSRPEMPILADSRRGLKDFPPMIFKMNASELRRLMGAALAGEQLTAAALNLARQNVRHVFITLSEAGMLGASPEGNAQHVPALPLRGTIDIVGAGDAVSANLVAALASGADLREALVLANAAASVVIHKLGTTGTASIAELGELLLKN